MAVDFNPILDPEFIKDPLPILLKAWSETPILRHDNLVTTWSVFSFDDCRALFTDPDVFGSEIPQENKDASLGALLNTLIAVDPPRHTRLRKIANTAFIPPVIRGFEEQTRALVNRLIDEVLEKGDIEIVNDLSAQITVGMITAILGLPASDWPQIRKWTTDIANNTMADVWLKERDPEREAITARVTGELADYFHDYIEDRKNHPREGDLISQFMTAEVEGERLTDEEVEGTAMILLLAGNETTTNLITNMFRNLANNPDQLKKLKGNPELAKTTVEEVLRYSPSLRGTARRVKQPVSFCGEQLGPGDVAFAWLSTANRDPSKFERPHDFDIERKPNRHTAFAAGPHLCLGAPLARLEGRMVAEAIASRVGSIELLGEPDVAPSAVMDNVLSQRVRLTPA